MLTGYLRLLILGATIVGSEGVDMNQTGNIRGALDGVRVLDLCGPESQASGRMLADLGADVILIEPPGGSASRTYAPFANRGEDPERSLYFLHYNTNKRGIVLDIESSDGSETLRRLARTADVVLEGFTPGYLGSIGLDYEVLSAENPGLVITSITPFGQTGPYRNFKGPDIVTTALAGLTYAEGDVEGPPVTMPRYQSYKLGGVHAGFATLIALWRRDQTGQGQHVDISHFEVMSHLHLNLVRFASQQEVARRRGSHGGNGPTQYFQAKDGWVQLALTTARQWQEFAAWVGDPVLMDPKYMILSTRDADSDMINEKAREFIAQFTAEEFLTQGAEHRVTVAPANTVADFARHPHAAAHEFLTEVEHPVLGRYQAPGAPGVYSETPWAIRRPAPMLGQHTDEVLSELDTAAQRGGPSNIDASENDSNLPLEGVRILAFERVWAAPFGTRFLADYGAEVIKVESNRFSDGRVFDRESNPRAWLNTNSMYGEINRNKQSITLDLHTPGGQELFKRLVAESDIVVENNAPGAMDRFGLSYDELHKVKSDIIMVSCPGYGSWGPMRQFVAVGQSLTSFTGLGYLWGQPGSEWPSRGKNAYPDFITAGNVPFAIMAALHHRRRTGEGQRIELAQFRAAAGMIGLAFLENSLGKTEAAPWGNRDPNIAPQGIYLCNQDDRWVAISCPDDVSWQALADLMGQPGLAQDPRFSTLDARKENHDALDRVISEWARTRTPHQAMYSCQSVGVPAGVVATGEDLYRDPQLRSRGYIVEVDHPIPGRIEHPGMTVRFTRTPGQIRRPAPTPGQHTREVLSSLLGLSDGDFNRYEAEGALS